MRRQRKVLRLHNYDYGRAGAYFVTICTQQRLHLLGSVTDGEMAENALGGIVTACWSDLPSHYPVELDAFVVMPNHIHGVLVLTDNWPTSAVGAGLRPAPTPAPTRNRARTDLSEIVRALKSFSSRRINEVRGSPGVPVWQRGYHEHIVRSEQDLRRIRQYIAHNPARWHEDSEYTIPTLPLV